MNVSVALDGSDVPAASEALAAAKHQAVIVFAPGATAAKLIAGMEKRGSSPNFFCMSIVPAELTAQEAGSSVRGIVTCQVMPYPWSDISASILEFRKLAVASGVSVNYLTMEGLHHRQRFCGSAKTCWPRLHFSKAPCGS